MVALAAALRAVYENREEAARRGALAASRILETHSWQGIIPPYLSRIAELTDLSAEAAVQPETPERIKSVV